MPEIYKVDGLIFECESAIETWRVETLLVKEEGTIRWLGGCRPGDVLYDVGANIGIYSLYAARRGATVYAFEPHVGNAAALLRNAAANADLTARINVVTTPLHSVCGLGTFYYAALDNGSSGHQFEATTERAVATELRWATTVDAFVAAGTPPPTLVKIDVDGNELEVLKGMSLLLRNTAPREIQVEVQKATQQPISEFLLDLGFTFVERHDTENGKKLLLAGALPEDVAHNEVFERRGAIA